MVVLWFYIFHLTNTMVQSVFAFLYCKINRVFLLILLKHLYILVVETNSREFSGQVLIFDTCWLVGKYNMEHHNLTAFAREWWSCILSCNTVTGCLDPHLCTHHRYRVLSRESKLSPTIYNLNTILDLKNRYTKQKDSVTCSGQNNKSVWRAEITALQSQF